MNWYIVNTEILGWWCPKVMFGRFLFHCVTRSILCTKPCLFQKTQCHNALHFLSAYEMNLFSLSPPPSPLMVHTHTLSPCRHWDIFSFTAGSSDCWWWSRNRSVNSDSFLKPRSEREEECGFGFISEFEICFFSTTVRRWRVEDWITTERRGSRPKVGGCCSVI